MNRWPVEWLGQVSEDDDLESREMKFRVAEDWVSTDSDQLILPIMLIDKSEIAVGEPYPAILKQYGGDSLLNDMLMSEQELEPGSEWILLRTGSRLTVDPA